MRKCIGVSKKWPLVEDDSRGGGDSGDDNDDNDDEEEEEDNEFEKADNFSTVLH